MIPHGRTAIHPHFASSFLHDAILEACDLYANVTALVDTSLPHGHPYRRLRYSDYAEMIWNIARGFVARGFKPGEIVAIFLPNSWEFAATYHAATMAGLIPTPLNPHYRERELRYQLNDSGAVALITDSPLIQAVDLTGLSALRHVYLTRHLLPGYGSFGDLLRSGAAELPKPAASPSATIAALPYSSGTTGLPKGVMLSHENIVVNCRQFLVPDEEATNRGDDVQLCFLPLYHIYGLNVLLNPSLLSGNTVVLMPRFDVDQCARVVLEEGVTWLNLVPPVMNSICTAAEHGRFPRTGEHLIRGSKSGAAPLAPDLPRRFTDLTGIRVRQGYGMTEASPVTHLGYIESYRYKPESIGQAVAQTECRLVREDGTECDPHESGELVMRGPQFMTGYWGNQEATDSVLRDGWYWSGDIAVSDDKGFFRIVDRRKELIKYKGFPIAPAEVEAVLLEHPAVQDCGVVGQADTECGECPIAFVVLRGAYAANAEKLSIELPQFVADRLISYKQPRHVCFVQSIPRNPSGKILRKDLKSHL